MRTRVATTHRQRRTALAAVATAALTALAPARAAAPSGEVLGTRAQLRDAWLSVDAVVLGIYAGVDSSLGAAYHAATVREVWLGTPAPGRLLFKAPRGINAKPGDETLLMLWDRLNGATDAYLDTARERYGDATGARIGPDSLSGYLLPFPQYAWPLQQGKLRLKGSSAFPEEIKRSELKKEFQELEYTLLPAELYGRSDVVVHARVAAVDKRHRVIEGISVEVRVYVEFEPIEMIKGSQPDSLKLDYGAFPRSPRFVRDEQVILFLKKSGNELILEAGKRAVFHVQQGSIAETGQPLREFFKALRAGEG
ncbi:MAG TPA: hypothetical protein VFE28_10080 [Candidatus Krumholzibacteria bacterium]|nr:hypothetical protein [Candidatus Krumholzibacteria bacterium]